MINVEQSITINRPIEEVFAFVGDQRNAPQWQHGVLEVRRTSEGALGIGTIHTAVRKFMGRKMEASTEYIQYEPNENITFTGDSGPMHFETSYLTESTAEGTTLTCQMKMQPGGLFGLAEPLIAASLRREMEANFGDLKDLLENQAEEITT